MASIRRAGPLPVSRAGFEEPTIPARLRRPLAAVWISIGVHAALIALVQVAPPTSRGVDQAVIEARLVDAGTQQPVPAQADAARRKPPPPQPEPKPDARKPEPQPAPAQPDVSPVSAAKSPDPAPVADAAPQQTPAQPVPEPPAASAPVPDASRRRPLEVTTAVDLTYYSARELDVQPRALREIVPEYPALADRRRLSGTVRLQIELEADGRVRDVSVVSANPPGLFEESALTAFREARFAPAQRQGRPVRARVLIEVVYDWEGRN